MPEGWQLWMEETATASEHPVTAETPIQDSEVREPASDSDRLRELEDENQQLRAALTASVSRSEEAINLDDARVLQEVGVYRYHHPLESAAAYQGRLSAIERRIAASVKTGTAIEMSERFTMNNSLVQGRRLTSDLSRLMLRAYNAEVENSVRTLRAGNIQAALRRIQRSRDAIAKLGSLMDMHISDDYHLLRVEELELTSDWLMKKQEEREAAREERARLREERRVQLELEEERARLDKERGHLVKTIATLESQGRTDPVLADRLTAVDQAIEANDFRAVNIRAGYVYVISNEGAFGEGVVKIGLTRRLEPLDRIAELSGAAVPFKFDVHALFFSADAVSLETELHRHFSDRAMNRANARKEFFFARPAEVRDVLLERVGNILEFAEMAEAAEYRQSLGSWPERRQQALA